ncbi:MAG TPA: SMC family ATPase [Gemmataceae bacterium]|nr:SMC family ATPase [Gemmataceae bacterium]
MIPRRIELENFLSFGSPPAEIEFTDDEPLWVIAGPNGVGKSAVFDAMTYALFGCHRGGASDHASLVRHGANGFRVAFEFEFNGAVYRITRTRTRGGRTTQRVERRKPAGDGWEPVENVNSVAEVKAWSERTLGLGFDAFTASVLLRQGEADAVITAGGTDRLKILKKIIGVERYEELSKSVHAAATSREGRLKELKTQLNGLTPVSDAEVEAARKEQARAEDDLSRARHAASKAANRVPLARQWAELESDRQGLEQRIRDAEARLAKADALRTEHGRLKDLKAAVPVLRRVVALRGRLSEATDALGKLRDEERRLAADVDRLTAAAEQAKQKAESHRRQAEERDGKAKQLRKEIEQKGKLVPTADEAAKLKADLSKFPPDLADQLAAAHTKAQSAANAFAAAGQAKAKAAGILEQAKEQQRKFEAVGVGVPCSRCGQLVSEEHARRERARLAEEVRELEHKLREAEDIEEKKEAEKRAADEEWKRLNALDQDQARKSQQLKGKKEILTKFGVTEDADELRRHIDALKADADGHEQAARKEAESQRSAAAEANRLDKEGQEAAKRLLDPLDADLQRLIRSGVEEEFEKLRQDEARRAEWARQRGEVTKRIADIPADCRVPVADAEAAAQKAGEWAVKAEQDRDAARERANTLSRQAEGYQKKVQEVADAERQAGLHRKLDDLLGKTGLQRELVRSAEREIVRLANTTVQNLSDGDLTIELDDNADGGDEAFALRVHRGDDPTPTGVHYLSGSQKFRVAVSVALAIGRFAAGQARPLESVIIDEGFGSLDRDGLRAVAEELIRLRQYLRRIILVSHQEDFADRFPVVIKLTHAGNGTRAAPVRR